MTSARVPALMFASCASATTLAASACSFLAIVSGLSILTSTAPAATSWPPPPAGDTLPPRDRDLGDASIAPRRDVEPCRIDLALHQQRFAPHQIPERQAGDGSDHQADDDGRNTPG